MKKALNTVIACALALFFLSISDVFAVDTTKLANKEFKITGVAERFTAAGYDGSGQITQGTLEFGNPGDGVIAVHNVASDLFVTFVGGFFELNCITELGPYTTGLDKIKSTECTVACYDAALNQILTFGPGSCDAKIVFSSNTAFTGTITLPDFWDVDSPYVLTLKGTFVGKYPPPMTEGTSLRDALRNRAPEGVRKLFRK